MLRWTEISSAATCQEDSRGERRPGGTPVLLLRQISPPTWVRSRRTCRILELLSQVVLVVSEVIQQVSVEWKLDMRLLEIKCTVVIDDQRMHEHTLRPARPSP